MSNEIESMEKLINQKFDSIEVYNKEVINRLDKQIENNRQDFVDYITNHDKKHETESEKRTNEIIKVYENYEKYAVKSDERIESLLTKISDINMASAVKNEQLITMQEENKKRDKKFNKLVIIIASGMFIILAALIGIKSI